MRCLECGSDRRESEGTKCAGCGADARRPVDQGWMRYFAPPLVLRPAAFDAAIIALNIDLSFSEPEEVDDVVSA